MVTFSSSAELKHFFRLFAGFNSASGTLILNMTEDKNSNELGSLNITSPDSGQLSVRYHAKMSYMLCMKVI